MFIETSNEEEKPTLLQKLYLSKDSEDLVTNTVYNLCFFLGISQSSSLKGDLHDEKMMICAFLARVMHGKQLGKLSQSEAELGPPPCTPFYICIVISVQQYCLEPAVYLLIYKAICYSSLVFHTETCM